MNNRVIAIKLQPSSALVRASKDASERLLNLLTHSFAHRDDLRDYTCLACKGDGDASLLEPYLPCLSIACRYWD